MQNDNAKYKTNLFGRCYQFSLAIIAVIDKLPQTRSSQVIGNQLLRSATSIGANMTEGRAAGTRLELKKFNEIALKSANESKYWLELMRDAKLASSPTIQPLLNELEELTKMIASGVLRLKGRKL